jgi:NADH pyrophosphatase NudC (nudix superfamily)
VGSFFKKLQETAKSTADTLGAKSAELVSAGKLKVEKMQLESKVKEKKTDLGGLVYLAYLSGQEPDTDKVTALCEEIKELEAQISSLDKKMNEETAEGKDTVQEAVAACKQCGQALTSGAKFCPGCGTQV